MTSAPAPSFAERQLNALQRGLASWRFAAGLLFTVLLLKAGLLLLLLVPAQAGTLGAFAEDFRTWCFGYDPATGGYEEWASLALIVWEPVVLGAIVLAVWWRPLKEAWAVSRRQFLRPFGVALVLVSGLAGCMTLMGPDAPADSELPFPAEALRTEYPAPSFLLTNQAGEEISVEALRGKVVLLTAVYASCGHTCPQILNQTKAALAELDEEELADLRVVGVTLDPGNDSQEVLARLADLHGFSTPLYNLVTGEPAAVERALDDMDISRSRDPETGIIEHANLFLLVDRQGRVAYRFTLGDRQQQWLVKALKILLAE